MNERHAAHQGSGEINVPVAIDDGWTSPDLAVGQKDIESIRNGTIDRN